MNLGASCRTMVILVFLHDVVGTPFAQSDITDQVARLMVGFGCGFLVLWPHLAPNASPFTNMDVGHAD